MVSSLASAVTSAVLFSAAASAASYQLFDSYTSDNFLDKFQPFVVGGQVVCVTAKGVC